MLQVCSRNEQHCIFLLKMKVTPNKYSETDIIRLVEFLIGNIYVEFGGRVTDSNGY